MKTLVLIALTAFALNAFADHKADHMNHKPTTNAEFEKLKGLVGHWEGTSKMGEKEMPVTADYTLTSGGTVIEEKLFAGTEHEMTSMYYPEGKAVAMTHYCSMGNRPKMTTKKTTDKTLTLEMKGTDGIKNAKEMHMHAMQLTWNSPTEITHMWTSFNKGKKADEKTFVLTKK